MAVATTSLEDLVLDLTQDIQIDASLEECFAALLEQMGPRNEGPDGTPLPMTIEPRPGGRWYRDLGGDNGSGDQATYLARDHRTALHVVRRHLEPSVSARRG